MIFRRWKSRLKVCSGAVIWCYSQPARLSPRGPWRLHRSPVGFLRRSPRTPCRERGGRPARADAFEVPDRLPARAARQAGVGGRPTEVHVNESVGAHDFLSAAEHRAYLAATERSGADGSVLAFWRDPCGFDNCAAPTLDGLLDRETRLPRPAWWASKWCARGVAGRVAASSTDTSVPVLASVSGRRRADALAGYYDPHDRLISPAVDIRLRLRGLQRIGVRSGPVQVRVDVVGGSGEAAVTPRHQAPTTVHARGGTLRMDVGPLSLHDALRVRVRASDSAAPRSAGSVNRWRRVG